VAFQEIDLKPLDGKTGKRKRCGVTEEKMLSREDCVAGILKFDNEIMRIIALCQNLCGKIDNLATERNGMGNDYSARILSNMQIASFIEEYSEIVRSHDVACKEFSRLDADLEKIMAVENGAQESIRDVKQTLEEVTSNFNFKTDFDEAHAYISEALTPAVNRIIEVGQAVHAKAQDALASFTPRKYSAKNIPCFKIGRVWHFCRSSIEKWMEVQEKRKRK